MLGAIEPAIRKFIADNFAYRAGAASISDDESLLERGLVDSTGVLELVFYLEKTYSIKVNDDEVMPENLDSVQRIAQFVRSKADGMPRSRVA